MTLFAISALIIAAWKLLPIPRTTASAFGNNSYISETSGATEDTYIYKKQFETDSKIFYCATLAHTESSCRLHVSDIYRSHYENLGITLDYGSQKTGLLLSPDRKHVAVILEHEVIVISTDALERTMVAQTPVGMEFGLNTGFPSFVPYGRWIDANHLELELYSDGTMEPFDSEPPVPPIEKRIVSIPTI